MTKKGNSDLQYKIGERSSITAGAVQCTPGTVQWYNGTVETPGGEKGRGVVEGGEEGGELEDFFKFLRQK